MRTKATRSHLSLRPLWLSLAGCAALSMQPLFAASFVVPPDRQLVQQATAIVIASPLASRTELRHQKIIETVTTMSIEEVLKGSIDSNSMDVYEPGGVYEKRVSSIPGVPRFRDGDRYILFLLKTDEGIWRVLDLVLGKFRFDTDTLGHDVAMRDSQEIVGWDPDGKPHREQNRAAQAFVDFIRTSVKGGPAREDYLIPAEPLVNPSSGPLVGRKPGRAVVLTSFTPASYTYIYGISTGARWNVFPTAVSFFSTGANAAALTAFNNAIASWNSDPSSNVNLANAGVDSSGTHTGGVANFDGQNTVAFERDLTAEYGAPAFSCTSSSYSGILGIAAVTNDSGTYIGPNGDTFNASTEGDVEMNVGVSTCAFLISLGDFNSAVTHELGHTLGFRHSDQERNLFPGPAGSCSGDALLECTTSAIMNHFIPSGKSGALQTWDQHAVDLLYPNATVLPPTAVTAMAQSSTSVQVSWTAAAGATEYHVYRSSDHLTYTKVGSPLSSPFTDTTASADTAYLYKVRSSDGVTESNDSNFDLATTVIFTDSSLTSGVTPIKVVHLSELRTAVNAVRTLAGLSAFSFTDPTLDSTVTVKAVHMTDLRTALNGARSTLGLSAVTYTDPTITVGSTIVKAAHVTDLRGGVQ